MSSHPTQTEQQVAAILSMPAGVLVQLARTSDQAQQEQIAMDSQLDPVYLSMMRLSAPPSHQVDVGLLADWMMMSSSSAATTTTTTTTTLSHPAIPHILHQVFSPNSPVILAPSPVYSNSSLHSHEYQPTYRSVDDWAMQVAQMTSPSIDPNATHYIASQLKLWAVHSQDTQLQQHVQEAKQNAVMLAAKAEAVIQTVQSSHHQHHQLISQHPTPFFNSDILFPNLTNYTNTYQHQLACIAARYYSKLHQEAIHQLNLQQPQPQPQPFLNNHHSNHLQPQPMFISSTSHPTLDKLTTQNVQAAAVAALTANALAASDMASRAGQTLSNTLGMSIQTNLTSPLPPPGPAAIAATNHGLALVHHRPHHSQAAIQLDVPTDGPPIVPNPTTYSLSQAQLHTHSQRPISSLPHHLRPSIPPSSPVLPSPPPSSQMGLQTPSSHLLPPPPPPPPSNHSPISLNTQIEKLWRTAQDGECTERTRDYLLSYAHATYSKKPTDASVLLPLLHTLLKHHPNHLPSLLLLSCVYYSQGDYNSSLLYNNQILLLDHEYVEAMSNLGTTQRALGKWVEAEEWWWRAIKLRPTYFDAFDNLLGVLCNPQSHPTSVSAPPTGIQPQPRYPEALQLCSFVEAELFGPPAQLIRPLRLPPTIPYNHVHRVQNLFYAKGNLLIATGKPHEARDEYEKAFEVVCGMPRTTLVSDESDQAPIADSSRSGGYSLVDVVLAMASIGMWLMAMNANRPGSGKEPHVIKVLSDVGLWDPTQESLDTLLVDPLRFAQQRRQIIKTRLLKIGGGILPSVLLLPDNLEQLVRIVMNASNGLLPVFKHNHNPNHPSSASDMSRNPALQSPNQTTSTVLLTLAKSLQDAIAAPMSPGAKLDGIPPSPSLLLPLYYLALYLHPSPSTCNNLGILLSTMPSTTVLYNNQPGRPRRVINGQYLAHAYYVQGLQRDRNHPHLYTNLGSLLKDMGQLAKAVEMYEKAVECNPNFDVALANLANAVKDMGRVQESVQWYVRAVHANPNFPEAVCGLVNALGGVCDWRDRGGVGRDPIVDGQGKLLLPPTTVTAGGEANKLQVGLMGKVAKLVDKQLDEGTTYGKGVLRQSATIEQWLEALALVKTGSMDGLSSAQREHWRSKLEHFFNHADDFRPQPTGANRFNEGGFVIRLIERCARQVQRRWYIDVYGPVVDTTDRPEPIKLNNATPNRSYCRLTVPSSLGLPPVPTVLPFHTFTYPLSARECRLISHRNALRISLSTLSQPWIGNTVYPPPPPPFNGRIKIGYISSDFNNHPLAHLMQSVFGIHNRKAFEVICYATTNSDGSTYRKKIERDTLNGFVDVAGWDTERVVKRIVEDRIHILINLNGYTKGARNEIFAARPCPVQMEFMGFAGTLASGWTDWIIADPIVCPPRMVSGEKWRRRHGATKDEQIVELVEDLSTDFDGDLDPESVDEDWVYTEKFIYMPHSYFVCDHKQGFRDEKAEIVDLDGLPAPLNRVDVVEYGHRTVEEMAEIRWAEEEVKRWKMRQEMFPDLADDVVIFANFNQLYKIDPVIFKYWLEILAQVPKSILWLLRFPAPGEPHLKMTAERWAGSEVASRIRFTDVAPKALHIQRGRIADLFLDSTECNAHTTAADILWSGTPILTLPRQTNAHKMCSRVAASIALATGFGTQMIATSLEDYKRRAVELAHSLNYHHTSLVLKDKRGQAEQTINYLTAGTDELAQLRRSLFESRDRSALFDTNRWVRNLEIGLRTAWKRFVEGTDFEEGSEWKNWKDLKSKKTCSIWVEESDGVDEDDLGASLQRFQFMEEEEARFKSGI